MVVNLRMSSWPAKDAMAVVLKFGLIQRNCNLRVLIPVTFCFKGCVQFSSICMRMEQLFFRPHINPTQFIACRCGYLIFVFLNVPLREVINTF